MTSEQTQRHRVFLREFTASEAAIRGFVRRLVLSRADAVIEEQTGSAGLVPGLRVMGEERRIVAGSAPLRHRAFGRKNRSGTEVACRMAGAKRQSRGDEKENSYQFYL